MIVLGVPHCAWRADRVASMRRIRAALGLPEGGGVIETPAGRVVYIEQADTKPSPPWDWSVRLWRKMLAAADATTKHTMLAQDDVGLPEFFWSAFAAMLPAASSEVVSFHLNHPLAPTLARWGERYATGFGCAGVGWTMPIDLFRDFYGFRSASEERARSTTEDTLMDAWLVIRRRRVWQSLPTLVSHDSRHESTYGDTFDHFHRDTSLDWSGFDPRDLCNPAWWRAGLRPGGPRHLVFAGTARPGISRRAFPVGFDGYAPGANVG